MKYTENYKIKWHDTNADRNVRLSQYLVYMQETANLQLRANGTSLDDVRDEMRLGFILSKIKLIFHKELAAYEDISVNTWTCPSRGFTFSRCFEIKKGEEKVAEAISFWALLNIDTRMLTRVDGFDLGLESEDPLDIAVARRIKQPEGELVLLGKREIRYSDIDYNMHMNNTKYPDMICDFMPIEKISEIKTMTLEFLHESALGDTLSFYGASDGNRFYFKTVNENGDACLTAEIEI
jgi:acyl-ACP thioesterase